MEKEILVAIIGLSGALLTLIITSITNYFTNKNQAKNNLLILRMTKEIEEDWSLLHKRHSDLVGIIEQFLIKFDVDNIENEIKKGNFLSSIAELSTRIKINTDNKNSIHNNLWAAINEYAQGLYVVGKNPDLVKTFPSSDLATKLLYIHGKIIDNVQLFNKSYYENIENKIARKK